MALKQGNECFTKWSHVENGNVMSRRLHRIEIQARDGRLHIVQGDKLPDFIQTCSGDGYKGLHIAQILIDPSRPQTVWSPSEPAFWPKARDVVHVALGGLGLLLARFFVNLASGQF